MPRKTITFANRFFLISFAIIIAVALLLTRMHLVRR